MIREACEGTIASREFDHGQKPLQEGESVRAVRVLRTTSLGDCAPWVSLHGSVCACTLWRDTTIGISTASKHITASADRQGCR